MNSLPLPGANAIRQRSVALSPFTKRKTFVSYHHGTPRELYLDGDQRWYNSFVQKSEQLDVLCDHSLNRRIRSHDSDYVMDQIREHFLTGASVTIVLCGEQAPWRKYLDWEIRASIHQGMGLVGIILPSNPMTPDGYYVVPDRLYLNILTGYAVWTHWSAIWNDPGFLNQVIETSLQRAKMYDYNNSLPTREWNGDFDLGQWTYYLRKISEDPEFLQSRFNYPLLPVTTGVANCLNAFKPSTYAPY